MEITEIRRTERRKREAENGKGKTEKMEITEIRRTKRKGTIQGENRLFRLYG